MRNLSHQKISSNAKSDNGLLLPEITSVRDAWGEWVFFNANAKGKIKSSCFLHNFYMRLIHWRTRHVLGFGVWNSSRGRRSCSFT